MSSLEPSTDPEPTPPPGEVFAVEPAGGVVSGRTWAFVLAAAILAGAGSWLAGEGVLRAYRPSFEPTTRPYPSGADLARIARARAESGAIAFGVAGGLAGLWLGLAGGMSRNSPRAAAGAATIGLLAGGPVEAGLARLTLWLIDTRFDPQTEEIVQSLLGHEALWGPVGLAGGLAFGLGLGGPGRWWRASAGGWAGAALATVLYECLGALAFATHGTHQAVANSAVPRALAHLLIPLGAAIGATLAASGPRKRPDRPPART